MFFVMYICYNKLIKFTSGKKLSLGSNISDLFLGFLLHLSFLVLLFLHFFVQSYKRTFRTWKNAALPQAKSFFTVHNGMSVTLETYSSTLVWKEINDTVMCFHGIA
jgi:hypothetical protein